MGSVLISRVSIMVIFDYGNIISTKPGLSIIAIVPCLKNGPQYLI